MDEIPPFAIGDATEVKSVTTLLAGNTSTTQTRHALKIGFFMGGANTGATKYQWSELPPTINGGNPLPQPVGSVWFQGAARTNPLSPNGTAFRVIYPAAGTSLSLTTLNGTGQVVIDPTSLQGGEKVLAEANKFSVEIWAELAQPGATTGGVEVLPNQGWNPIGGSTFWKNSIGLHSSGTVCWVNNGTLPSGSFKVAFNGSYEYFELVCIADHYVQDQGTWTYDETRYYWQRKSKALYGDQISCQRTVSVDKLVCSASSADTRKLYGPPNMAGVPGVDPNSPLRNFSYYPWEYKGGLFVGRGPWNRDQSGVARMQFWSPSSFADSSYAGLSLLDMGAPKRINTSIRLAASVPSSSDSNIGVGNGNYNWANRWSRIAAFTAPISLSNSTQTLAEMPTNFSPDYVNFRLPSDWSPGAPTSIPSKVIVSRYWDNFPITGTDDNLANIEDGLDPAWRYFATQQFITSSGLGFPVSDGAPRIWKLNVSAAGQ
ncbi:MAG: hypothetical protein JST35_08320 [Armatimonadetes bacterium]|nr:hypothetical protein [Armatimonadota bacterium]